MKRITLILDLDGVLITTPIWKPDELDSIDQYSTFNEHCIDNLNVLLSTYSCNIWLSSTRRTVKTIDEFNVIFKNRNINTLITGFLPEYKACKTRREEIIRFIEENNISSFLIIDDDKSLNDLPLIYKEKLILTPYLKGFDAEKLKLATRIIEHKIIPTS